MPATCPTRPDTARPPHPLLVYAPTASRRMLPCPPLGLAVLCGYLRRRGVRATAVDLELLTAGDHRWPAPGPVGALLDRAPPDLDNPERGFLDPDRVDAHLRGAIDDPGLAARVRAWAARLPGPMARHTHLGLSVMSLQQLTTSLCLARHLTRRHDLQVVLGGSLITGRLAPLLERYPFVHHLVLGEGEEPLWRLVRGDDPAAIPNLITRRHGRVVRGPRRSCPGQDLAPDFSDLPLQRYRQRELLVLPIEMSKGCRNRCAFCITGRQPVRLKPPHEVLAELSRGRHEHGARGFMAVDNAINISLAHAEQICRAIVDARLDVLWSAYFIPEEPPPGTFRLLRRAGCVQLRWGVETPAAGALERMHKPIDPAATSRALVRAAARGIWNHVLLMVGHPGEGPADLVRAAAFVAHNRRAIRSALISPLDLRRVDLSEGGEAAYRGDASPARVAGGEALGLRYRALASPGVGLRRWLLDRAAAACGVRLRRNFSRHRHDVQRDQFIFRAFAEALGTG